MKTAKEWADAPIRYVNAYGRSLNARPVGRAREAYVRMIREIQADIFRDAARHARLIHMWNCDKSLLSLCYDYEAKAEALEVKQ